MRKNFCAELDRKFIKDRRFWKRKKVRGERHERKRDPECASTYGRYRGKLS